VIPDSVLHEQSANPGHDQGEMNPSSWPALKAGVIPIFIASVSFFKKKKNESDALSDLFFFYFMAIGICTCILLASGSPADAEMQRFLLETLALDLLSVPLASEV